jgi:hypothetical protein
MRGQGAGGRRSCARAVECSVAFSGSLEEYPLCRSKEDCHTALVGQASGAVLAFLLTQF